MNIKRCVAAVALVLVSLGSVAGMAAGHDTAGSEGKWPKVSSATQ